MSVKYSFAIEAPYQPAGQQPDAINRVVERIQDNEREQVLLGVTGSGKTFTLANVIAKINRPAILLAPNKTLAAQLYSEMKSFFPKNSVEYFVSYYDYYQPEAFIPATNTYIEKDSAINEHIEQMRLKATRSMLERSDTVIVATVSALYGLGDPGNYQNMALKLQLDASLEQRSLLQQLVSMLYKRNEIGFSRGQYRVRGDTIDVFPADEEEYALRIDLYDDRIAGLQLFDPLTGEIIAVYQDYTLYPKSHHISQQAQAKSALQQIAVDLDQEYQILLAQGKIVEAERLKSRVELDLEMIEETGTCKGIENYSRYFSGRSAGDAPATLMDYLPSDAVLILDESHVMLPQIRGMYAGDRSRKLNLVNYGFRLAAALDNRPLTFNEFDLLPQQRIYVSATPGPYEKLADPIPTELVVRPTGILDPEIEVRSQEKQVWDVLQEIKIRMDKNERVLITTLTQKMSENITEFLLEQNIKVKYLHAKVDTVERSEILRNLRMGIIDVVVGINLLREGLDLPEVSLVAIFDADKEGFLRSASSLIQSIGRAARNLHGKAILYANPEKPTKSMLFALAETNRRREIQRIFNENNNIIPKAINSMVHDPMNLERTHAVIAEFNLQNERDVEVNIRTLTELMHQASGVMNFEKAKEYRDQILELKRKCIVQ